jgi:D-alanyl-lipoteichoic acid acyltransferase DltB (MBOAT superfamily)
VRNTFVIFLVSGFWHGADWTFIAWGGLHALYFLPLLLTKKNRKNLETTAQGKMLPSVKEFFQMLTTFVLVVFAWIFFRADNMAHAWSYISRIFSSPFFMKPAIGNIKETLLFIAVFMIMEWVGRENQYAIEKIGLTWKKPVRYAMYYAIVIVIFMFSGKSQEFIYFQF